MGVINILTDIVLIGLPMPYLYKLRLATPKKFLAMGMLSIGIGYEVPIRSHKIANTC
jgi:hypothetical protein